MSNNSKKVPLEVTDFYQANRHICGVHKMCSSLNGNGVHNSPHHATLQHVQKAMWNYLLKFKK